jgi:hypothetical protein
MPRIFHEICDINRGKGSRRLRLPEIEDKQHMKAVKLLVPAAFNPREDPWYSFLLEAESASGPQCGRKD